MRDLVDSIGLMNTYKIECIDSLGNLKWEENIHNLITNEGLNDILDKYLKGSAYTAAWYVGVIDNANWTAVAAGDTASGISLDSLGANSWQEFDDYSETVRQTLTLGTVSSQSVDNSASKAQFSINGTGTVRGAFVVSSNVKGGTSGVLYADGAFAATRAVENGDTLNVTITLTSASV